METINGYGNFGYLASGFCDLEKSIGDTKASVLSKVGAVGCDVIGKIGDAEGRLSSEIGDAECSILRGIGDSKATLIDRMGTYAHDNTKNQSDIAYRNQTALNAFERDIQNRVHETRMILTKEIGDKNDRAIDLLGREVNDVKDQMRFFEVSTAKTLCDLEKQGLANTSKILETLSANKYDSLKDELDKTRAMCYSDKYAHNFALQNQELSSLKQMINSVEQTQRFSSKTVQFGAGNVAIPTQTANQG